MPSSAVKYQTSSPLLLSSCIFIMEVPYSHLVLIFSMFLIALSYYLQQKKQRRLPPSPPALPIIGHLHLLKTAPHLAFQKLCIKYGPLISLRFGVCPILVVSSPSLAEECLTKTNDIVFANRPETISSKYLGYNNTAFVVSPYGDHWRNLRRVTTIHVFSSISLHRLSSIWTEEIRFMIHKLFSGSSEVRNSWKVIDMNSLFRELLFNLVMKMVAGKRWPSDQSTEPFARRAATNVCDYIPILRWIGYGGHEKSVISLHEERDKFVQDLIDETRHKEGGGDLSSTGRRTIIQALLSLQDAEPEYYTDDILKGIMITLFLAGTHSSSQTIEWAMSYMLNHPEILQKAKTELDNNVTPGHFIEDADLSKLTYLRCIINETLRIFPPAPTLLPHYSSEDCTIGGYRVPKGTTLLVNALAIHRDPDVWEEPNKFIPERFDGIDDGGCNEGSKFIPFGKGRRACPGAAMAMRVVGLTLGTLIQCFDWKRVGPEMVDLVEGPEMGKAKPLEALYKPRDSMINFISQL